MATKRILVVDDDSYVRGATEEILIRKGYSVDTAGDAGSALRKLEDADYDLLLSDIKMPGMSGLELLEQVRNRWADLTVILMTAYGTIEDAVHAMRNGAYNYIQKGSESTTEEMEIIVEQALKMQETERENRRLRSELQGRYGDGGMIGKAASMAPVFDLIGTVAESRATVLVTGESGTGKELVAKALHYGSGRRTGAFIRLNCAALPKDLMESELFGHEKGAFTGAHKQTRGRFEMADGGTLLLDEISEIDPSLQAKLLRVLQEREFERVGSTETIKVDVRIVATTNRDLQKEVEEGNFREDLYYRLNVIEVSLPPLRERIEDVTALAHLFVERYNEENGKQIEGFEDETLELLAGYDWPGNVRELENYVERAVVVAPGNRLTPADFPRKLAQGPALEGGDGLQVGLTVHEMERRLIMKTLESLGGNRTDAAAQLGISTRTLRNKLHEYGAMDAFKSGHAPYPPEMVESI
ncbi:MAG: sigma-54-dependent Fis family transcriptional regulator [Gemmatimonadetes bacterium]|jgi:DNA-binding NtrC family response regulator|nr:sigma-54-dependent Fis family transcriptional regulator [Gemmatimonadota bacterium]MBT4610835.1 sigma-54-dependent Fis family transcriptional regulator [Gemmatimonadota bacterium]MBT5056495.1 sigma-54-dependent Fis family transcriptional regulator [Gemmatimonadota bacterium]MBT5144436.1 sigma-54-dependent Fis family transcriptional regulator [Gemmatimonadota bacterium]MBT5587046.1 sigma-54-dependent Fis family transcriptional regulator [Gemmatimonadota bacterium]